MKILLSLIIFLFLFQYIDAQIISEDHMINWSNVGIPGGIPNNLQICFTLDNAIYGAGKVDSTLAIQNAINICNTSYAPGNIVYIPEGNYTISDTIYLNKSIVLRGAGTNKTRLFFVSDISKSMIIMQGPDAYYESSINLSNGYSKDSNLLVFNQNNDISSGDYIIVYQNNNPDLVSLNDCTWCGLDNGAESMTQITRVLNKTNDALVISPPLYLTFESQYSPRIRKISNMLENAGIEDIYLETKNNFDAVDTIKLSYTAYSWIDNIEIYHSTKNFIKVTNSFSDVISNSYVHEPQSNDAGRGYGYHLFGPNSNILVENNIAYKARHSYVLEGGGSGCVIAYSYSIDPFESSSPNWVSHDLATHGAYPYMNLFEGNVVQKWQGDYVHGSAGYNTGFRNYFLGGCIGNYTGGLWPVEFDSWNYYNNVVGNILGCNSSSSNSYEGYSNTIYKLGFNGSGDIVEYDSLVKQTLLRHGNYDYFNNAFIWDYSISDNILPDSLYLSYKPSWWSPSLNWPPFGPDTSFQTNKIPAQIKFEEILALSKNSSIDSSNLDSPSSNCFDNIQNFGESGIDCGGFCKSCVRSYSRDNLDNDLSYPSDEDILTSSNSYISSQNSMIFDHSEEKLVAEEKVSNINYLFNLILIIITLFNLILVSLIFIYYKQTRKN